MQKILIFIGIFMLIFGTSMAEPMTGTAFLFQICLIFGGLLVAITGGLIDR